MNESMDRDPCNGGLHPMAVRGIELFNQGEYWHAHEALEAAWLEEPGEVRNLYRGILQAGVVYLHITRANFRGAVKVYKRSRRWLDPFPGSCRGINVDRLRTDLEAAFAEVCLLGADSLQDFDPLLLKPIEFTPL